VASLVMKSRALTVVVEKSRHEASLWRQFKQNDDDTCRQLLFDQYKDFALMLSNREYRRRPAYGFEKLDFDQLAYCGLLQAIDRYDPMSDCSFKTFARYRIVGSMADGIIKSSDQASAYFAASKMEKERLSSLMNKEKNSVSELNNLDTLRELTASLAISVLIESVTEDNLESMADASAPNGYESLRFNQIRRNLFNEIDYLPKREKIIVKRHYIEDMTFALIAKLLGLSKGRISQLHNSAIQHLRKKLKRR